MMSPKIHIYPPNLWMWPCLEVGSQVKMKPSCSRVDPNPGTGIPIRRGESGHRHTQKEGSHVGMGAVGAFASTSQGMQMIARHLRKPGERHGTHSSSETPEGDTLILNFLEYCEKINFCCFKPSNCVVIRYGSLRKLIASFLLLARNTVRSNSKVTSS